MDVLLHWAGFLGAWLLVGGPIFQAAIELRDETIDRDAFAATMKTLPPVPRTSPWWWLLPPVAYVLIRRRSTTAREAVLRAMDVGQRAQFLGFQNKARGWFAVAAGAFLIALKETGELVELYELPIWVFWVGIVVLSIAAVGSTISQMSRSDAALHIDEPGYAESQRAEREKAFAERRFERRAQRGRKRSSGG
jgi:hypothetical protein